jgi:hypothetical protein
MIKKKLLFWKYPRQRITRFCASLKQSKKNGSLRGQGQEKKRHFCLLADGVPSFRQPALARSLKNYFTVCTLPF